MEIHNQSPFSVIAMPTVCQHDDNHLLVVVKGSFDISPTTNLLTLSDEQEPVATADEFWGDPTTSSVRLASDLVLRKTGTDIAVIGSAVSEKAVTSLNVGVLVGPMRSVLRITGRRYWEKSASGYRMTSPETFTTMPLLYENAFGGSYLDKKTGNTLGEDRNPVGKGIFDPESYDAGKPPELPNIELPDEPVSSWRDRPAPAGCGFTASHWQPRRQHTGTYDSEWEAHRLPLLPQDFDDRANHAASPALFSKDCLLGGEPVQLANLHSRSAWKFSLPAWTIVAQCQAQQLLGEQQTTLDTVTIDLDANKLLLTWRTSFAIHWNVAMLQWLKLTARQAI